MEIIDRLENSIFKFYLIHSNPKAFKIYISKIINSEKSFGSNNTTYVINLKATIDKKCNFNQSYYLNHFIDVSFSEYRFLKSAFINFSICVVNFCVFYKFAKREFVFMDNNRYLMNNINKSVYFISLLCLVTTSIFCTTHIYKWLIYLGFKNCIILDEEHEIVGSINKNDI